MRGNRRNGSGRGNGRDEAGGPARCRRPRSMTLWSRFMRRVSSRPSWTWPSTWTDRLDRDRTPSIPGHDVAGVITALGYGTTGLSVGQRVFGLADWYRDGALAEFLAIEARNLAPLPEDVDFTVGASLPISGLTAWQGLFHARPPSGWTEGHCARRRWRSRINGDAARTRGRRLCHRHRTRR